MKELLDFDKIVANSGIVKHAYSESKIYLLKYSLLFWSVDHFYFDPWSITWENIHCKRLRSKITMAKSDTTDYHLPILNFQIFIVTS